MAKEGKDASGALVSRDRSLSKAAAGSLLSGKSQKVGRLIEAEVRTIKGALKDQAVRDTAEHYRDARTGRIGKSTKEWAIGFAPKLKQPA